MSKTVVQTPLPLFDTIELINDQSSVAQYTQTFAQADFDKAKSFLLSYNGNQATFNAYRREVERLLQWSWLVANKSIQDLRRTEFEAYIEFCQHPPQQWIGTKKCSRFLDSEGKRIPNSDWRPFVATVTKAQNRVGLTPNILNYQLSQKAIQEIFTVCSSFYNFLILEEYATTNPVLHIRQKSRYFRKVQGKTKIRRLSELQWNYVIETATQMADSNPALHEKTLFIMSALYAMYLRISELTSSARWTPKMSDFYRDHDGLWWFVTVGKGNKQREISVSDAMLQSLKRYRLSLGLTTLPSPQDNSPLIPKTRGHGPITSTNHIRRIVQSCFDEAILRLQHDNFHDEATLLTEATVHWLRHTGISEDVKHRPREHVRDDAGHSSSAITDKYIDIELRARHASAKKKPITQN